MANPEVLIFATSLELSANCWDVSAPMHFRGITCQSNSVGRAVTSRFFGFPIDCVSVVTTFSLEEENRLITDSNIVGCLCWSVNFF